MKKTIVGAVVKLTVTATCLLLLVKPELFGLSGGRFGNFNPSEIATLLKQAGSAHIISWLAIAALIRLAGMLAGVLRWRLLLAGQGLRMPFWYMVQSWFVGRMFGIFMPGTIGLDGYRFIDSTRYTGDAIKCATVIAVEKLIGFIALTLLVFLTFPFGFSILNRVFSVNIPLLIVVLACLGVFVILGLTLLLSPHVIQILVSIVPTPALIRRHIHRFGAALSAYGAHKKTLLLAVGCGFIVHLAAALMYFATMMAVRAENVGITDILFAAPLMTYAIVFGPTVGGLGIREVVFALLLSAKTGGTAAVTFANLGWWVGDFVPFVIGCVVFVWRTRPFRSELNRQMTQFRQQLSSGEPSLEITPELIIGYRRLMLDCLVSGAAAALVAGGFVGLLEAAWLNSYLVDPSELSMFWWAPTFYGVTVAPVGMGLASGVFLLLLLARRTAQPSSLFSAMAASLVIVIAPVIGRFRINRDMLGDHGLAISHYAALAAGALGVGLAIGVFFYGALRVLKSSRQGMIVVACLVYGATVGVGYFMSEVSASTQAEKPIPTRTEAPPILFIAIDTLRADYLKVFSSSAPPTTPALDAFARDAVVFKTCIAQASWTKPSFATLFTGLYPQTHTATSVRSSLPDSVVTLAEALSEAGYYTQGFANNPNIAAEFNFDQGFDDYVDLKRDLLWGAGPSAEKLVLYQVLRRVKERLTPKMIVTDYYQPADSVTNTGLSWLDTRQATSSSLYFLFLHYFDPHDPYFDHDASGKAYARVRTPNPDPGKLLTPMKDAYITEIEYLDSQLGRLFDGLRQRGLYDSLLIVLVADHGEEFYEHGGWWHGQTLYEEQIHVPLIIKFPRMVNGGAVVTNLVRHVDVMPTLLQLAKASPVDAVQGVSLLDAVGQIAVPGIEHAFSATDLEDNILESLRTTDAKIIHANPDNPRKLPPVAFYDLNADPNEQNNIVDAGDARQSMLESLISDETKRIEASAVTPDAPIELTPELEEQLGNVGYMKKGK